MRCPYCYTRGPHFKKDKQAKTAFCLSCHNRFSYQREAVHTPKKVKRYQQLDLFTPEQLRLLNQDWL